MKTSQKGSMKIIILFLAVLVIVVGLYFYFNKNGETKSIINSNQVASETTTANFLGSWSWMSSNESASFGFSLKQGAQPNSVYGDYCAVALNGNRTDCDPDKKDSFTGVIDGEVLKINFIDAYGGGSGAAVLTYNSDNSITWKVTEKPDGEYYIPDDAVLKKDRE